MKSRHLVSVLIASAAFAMGPSALAAGSHGKLLALSEAPRVNLDQRAGQWTTDAALREGMERIRTAVIVFRGNVHEAPARQSLALAIEGNLAHIVANCKLPPAADARLHVVLGELEAAAMALKRGSVADSALATVRATSALNEYGRDFHHPGWEEI